VNILYLIIIAPIEMLIESAYAFLSVVVRHNHVFSILGISILVNMLCLPLYSKAEHIQENERRIQKKMAKRIQSIKKNFKGDERYMILSMYYRENHYHPLMVLRSSSSLLIQIPFFIAAYHFLSHYTALNGEPFFFIRNLGAPDGLISVCPGMAINVLPILMTLINIISSVIYTRGLSPKEKVQLYIMALIFFVLLYRSPAALVLYWVCNNIFSLVKNLVYKTKKPLKILYFSILTGLFLSCIYVIFFRSQSRSLRLFFSAITVCLSIIIACIPLYVKLINFTGKRWFYHLKDDVKSMNNLYGFVCLGLFIICGLFIPFNVVASDPAEFSFLSGNPSPFVLLMPSILISFGLFVFWSVYIYLLASKKIKAILVFLITIAAIFGICNTFLFTGHYGMLSQTLNFSVSVDFSGSLLWKLLNIFVFLAIIFSVVLLFKINRVKLISSLMIIVCLSGFAMAAQKVVEIENGYRAYQKVMINNASSSVIDTVESKIEPVIGLSKTGKNILFIMLDRAIGSYFPLIMEERDELTSTFSGFVYYPNTVSFFRATNLGCPPLFGGYEYTPEKLQERKNDLMVTKHNESLLMLPALLQEQNYTVSVYDMPYVNYESAMDTSFFTEKGIMADSLIGKYTERFRQELGDNAPISSLRIDELLRRNFVMYSLFSISPPYLRGIIYQGGSYWGVIETSRSDVVTDSAVNSYSELYYLSELTKIDDDKDTLTIMVNNLAHSPSFLQYPDYNVVSRITDFGPDIFRGHSLSFQHYHVNAATYLLLAKWFDYLKIKGVYDNTRIIIVSDHDEMVVKPLFSSSLNMINTYYNPILLVKDFNAAGDIKTDMTFMTNADSPLLAIEGLLEEPKNPFTGRLLRAEKENGVNIFLGGSSQLRDYTGYEALDKISQFYHVSDTIFEEGNWKRITKRYE
jgi:YidC/Oxa1 family membrane protein insertase